MNMENIKNKFLGLLKNITFIISIILVVIYLSSGYYKWIEILIPVVATGFFIFSSIQNSLCIFAFLHSFTLSNIGYESCFLGTFVCFALVLIVKYCIGIKQKKYEVHKKLLITITAFTLLSCLISLPQKLYIGAFIYLLYLPLCYLVFAMRKELDIHQAINYMLFGFLLSCGLSIITLKLPLFQYSAFEGDSRFHAFTNQTNYTYMRALFLICYYMYRYLNNKLCTLYFILVYVTLSISTVATLSKFGIALLALITFIFIILYLRKDFKNGIKLTVALLIIAGIVFVVFYDSFIYIFIRFLNIEGNIITSLLTERDLIWIEYLKEWYKNPFTLLFGNGMLAQQVFIPKQQVARAAHSFYIFLIYRFGIIGCLVLVYIIYLFIKGLNKQSPKLIAYLPLIWLLIESLCENTFRCYNFTYFIFAIMILFCDTETKQNKEPTKISVEEQKKEHT